MNVSGLPFVIIYRVGEHVVEIIRTAHRNGLKESRR
jgi:hypothetical protein